MFDSVRSVVRAAAALAFICLAPHPGPARACSVCLAGDPVYSSQGVSAQTQGSVGLYAEVRGWRKESGLLPGEDPNGKEVNESQRLDLYASWTPLDRVTLTLDVPFAFNQVDEKEDGEQQTSRLNGLSDVSASVTAVLWRNRPVLPSTWIEGRAFLKFPTGESHERAHGVRDPHLQPGTGSWDFGFGLAAAHRIAWGSLYASASYRENTRGSLHYRYGNVVLANAALDVPLGHLLGYAPLGPVTAGFELNFRYADEDHFQGQRYRSSGGSVLYATPSLRLRLPWFESARAPSLRVAAQIPFTSAWLHGFQHEDPVWSLGVNYAF